MTYEMNIEISNKEEHKTKRFHLICSFSRDENSYGNGWQLKIEGKNFSPIYLDLRYDTSFKANKKDEWLIDWAIKFWNRNDWNLVHCGVLGI